MANARAEREKPSGSGAGCVTFLVIFILVASVVFGNRDAVLGAMGMGNSAIGQGGGEKNFLLVAVEKKATGTQGASFGLRRWGYSDWPFVLHEGESLTISQPSVDYPEDADPGDRGRKMIRVLEQGPQGQLIEASYGAAMVEMSFTYRVAGTTVTPVLFKSFSIAHLFVLLFISLVVALVLERVMVAFLKWGFSEAKPDKTPPPGP